MKKKRGAPPGNQNARRHGFYSKVLTAEQQQGLQEAAEIQGLDEEVAVARLKLRELMEKHPDRADLHLLAASTICRLLRTRHSLGGNTHDAFKSAIQKVINEIAIPCGIIRPPK